MSDQLEAAPPADALPRSSAIGSRAAAAPPVERARGAIVRGLVRAARPRQWLKNVLVLAAPGAAGVLGEWDASRDVALAFVAFCLVASGTYLLNDVRDAEADRGHPWKHRRPVASGVVPVGVAVATGLIAVALGLAFAATVSLELLGVVAGYLALTTAYTLWLRRVAVIDLACVASFFILRAVAGGVAVDVPLSRWFLIVASFGSLFMVAGKRAGEFAELGADRSHTRTTLGVYSLEYLRHVRTLAAAVAVTAYCLWAFEQVRGAAGGAGPFYELSIVPFVLFVLRYALLIDVDREAAPEDLVLGDRTLLAIAATWVVVFGCGVYVGG